MPFELTRKKVVETEETVTLEPGMKVRYRNGGTVYTIIHINKLGVNGDDALFMLANNQAYPLKANFSDTMQIVD